MVETLFELTSGLVADDVATLNSELGEGHVVSNQDREIFGHVQKGDGF